MKVLSFDQSSKISSFALWDDGKYIECGSIDLHKIKDTDERIRMMSIELFKVIQKYSPNVVIIEEVAQQSNVQALKVLARMQGCIIGFCAAHKIETHIIEPSRWRATLHFKLGPGVKRQELKQQAINYVKENYNLEVSEDECEAICIGEAAHKIYNF